MSIVVAHKLSLELAALKSEFAELRRLVDEQAEDEGLWFIDGTASEQYLQLALRRLHAAVERAEGTT